jgi:hypothetical protein
MSRKGIDVGGSRSIPQVAPANFFLCIVAPASLAMHTSQQKELLVEYHR